MSSTIPGLVSIVMPAYNAERHLQEAVNSVRAQDYLQWELLIVDDSSSDETSSIAARYSDEDGRIHYFRHSPNKGVAAARNTALEHAKGQYIAFLDSDDVWLPEKLSRQLAFMQENNVSVCYSGYIRMDESGNGMGVVTPPSRQTYGSLLRSNHIGNLTGIYDCSKLGKVFFTNFRHEDYVAWLALLKKAGEAKGIPEILAYYRVYAGSTSANKFRTLGWQWRIYRESEKLSFIRSVWLMCTYAWNALTKRL